jgi:hypothetical protein
VRRLTALCALAAWFALAATAQAATFPVTTTADTFDGTCDAANCSIRDAIDDADAADGNVVTLPVGTIKLTRTDPPSGELVITRDMTVTGAGARDTVIDGNGGSRVFRVNSNSAEVTFNDLTITGGQTPPLDPQSGHGGGIFSVGTVNLNRVAVRGNTAGVAGGGIYNDLPEFGSLSNVKLNIDRSTISGNVVTGDDGVSYGGGIEAAGDLTMTNSTVAGNTMSSPSGNTGGGISMFADVEGPSGILTLTNVTIAGNSLSSGSGAGVAGNALAMRGPVPIASNDTRANNTIVAGNTTAGAKDDCSLVNTTSTTNNISSDDSCGFTDAASKQNTDPGLLPLENRGGPTDTMGLTAASAAYNTGTNGFAPLIDQRGVVRPLVTTTDIGAVELALPTAETGSATGVTGTAATINGTAGNPHVDSGTAFFQYGTSTNYGATTSAQGLASLASKASTRKKRSTRRKRAKKRAHAKKRKARAKKHKRAKHKRRKKSRKRARAAATSFHSTLSGLQPGTLYHYRIGATNRDGTTVGADRTFQTAGSSSRVRVALAGAPGGCTKATFSLRVRTSVASSTKIRSVRVSLDGKVIKRSTKSRFTLPIRSARLRSGRHRLVVVATDRAGRRRTVRRTFRRCARQRLVPMFTG